MLLFAGDITENIKILQINEKNENFTRKTLKNGLNYVDNCIWSDKNIKKYVKNQRKNVYLVEYI